MSCQSCCGPLNTYGPGFYGNSVIAVNGDEKVDLENMHFFIRNHIQVKCKIPLEKFPQ